MRRQHPARKTPRSSKSAGGKKQRSRLKTRLLRVSAALLATACLLALALPLLIKATITGEFVENRIEESINSDAEIGSVDVSIFSFPARVTLHDVSLSRKGESTTRQVPVKFGEITLRASLWALLGGHLDVTDVTIRDAEIHTTCHKDGSTSIEELFKSPGGKKKRRKNGGGGRGFNAFEQAGLVTTLGGLTLENSKIHITLEEMGMELQCSGVNLKLDSISIDPDNLAKTNSANLALSAHVSINSTAGWQLGELHLSGTSATRIFNPATGDVEPDITGDFSLGKKSWLSTRLPFITRSWKHLDVLEKVGVTVARLPEKATFGRSEAVAAHYHLGKITVSKPLSIWVGDWELAALARSWLHTQTDQHEIRGELLASENSSTRFRNIILRGIGMLPDRVQETIAADINAHLFRNQRLLVKIKSSGDFSDPAIRPDGAVTDFAKAAKKATKKIIRKKASGLLKDVLGDILSRSHHKRPRHE